LAVGCNKAYTRGDKLTAPVQRVRGMVMVDVESMLMSTVKPMLKGRRRRSCLLEVMGL